MQLVPFNRIHETMRRAMPLLGPFFERTDVNDPSLQGEQRTTSRTTVCFDITGLAWIGWLVHDTHEIGETGVNGVFSHPVPQRTMTAAQGLRANMPPKRLQG